MELKQAYRRFMDSCIQNDTPWLLAELTEMSMSILPDFNGQYYTVEHWIELIQIRRYFAVILRIDLKKGGARYSTMVNVIEMTMDEYIYRQFNDDREMRVAFYEMIAFTNMPI